MKRNIFVSIGVLILLSSAVSFAEEENTLPEWLNRVDFGADISTDKNPTWYFETVQPLYRPLIEDKAVFIHTRANRKASDETYNLGLGYRWLTDEEEFLLGLNTFYDYTVEHSHYRVGFGAEVIGKVIETRANTYWGLSGKRLVAESSTTNTFEKAVDGADIEFGGPIIPHVPWISIYGSAFRYDYSKASDRQGWRVRCRLEPIECISTDLIVWDDNKGEVEYQVDLALSFKFDRLRDIKEAFRFSDKKFPDRNLSKKLLIPVERDFEVKVEKWVENKTGGVIFSIGRAN